MSGNFGHQYSAIPWLFGTATFSISADAVADAATRAVAKASNRNMSSILGVRRHLDLDHLVGVRGRLAFLDLVDEFHARRDLAPHGVLAVEEVRVLEADEELAARRIGIAGACHRDRAAA